MPAQNVINNIQTSSANILTFLANGTYTPSAAVLYAVVECVGGGGGSAGVDAPGALEVATSSSGGSGGYVRKTYSRSSLVPSVTVTVGTGGAGGAAGANPGTAGGDTTFLGLTAGGGQPGIGTAAGATAAADGGLGGTATGGDVNIVGYTGASASFQRDATYFITNQAPVDTPSQAASGGVYNPNQTPRSGSLYGGGASGHCRTDSFFPGSQAGAAGAAGIVIITEFLGA